MTTLVVFCAFISLAVDYGRVQLVKTELRSAADAAARAAAGSLSSGTTAAQNAAVQIAGLNTADGRSVALNTATDVEFGMWDTSARTFTVLTGPAASAADAVRITARRTAANGNPVNLTLAPFIGRNTCDVRASGVARMLPGTPGGCVGLSSITVKNNALVASYDSSANPNPTPANARSNGALGSNGQITGGNNNTVRGAVNLGPAGSVSGFTVTGSTNTRATAMAAPTLPPWVPQMNPGGISQNYTSTGATLPAGAYWFTSLVVPKSKPLTFAGTSTLYVNGNIEINDLMASANLIPASLVVYQYGAGTFGDNKNNLDVVAKVIAPGVSFSTKNNCTLRGWFVFDSIEFKNNGTVYCDEQLGNPNGIGGIQLVK